MAKFQVGDEVKVTRDFKAHGDWVGSRGVLMHRLSHTESSYEWVLALNGDEGDALYVYEEEIDHG